MTTSSLSLEKSPILGSVARNWHFGIERFLLAQHWSLHVYRYHAVLYVAGEPFELCPGGLTLVPPNTVVEYHHQGLSSHVYAHFQLPEPEEGAPTVSLPIFTDLQSDFPRFERSMETMAEVLPLNRARAEIKLWDLLHDLAARGQSASPQRHPSLEKAMSLIELRLGEPITVTALAREVGLSHNHLTRLFQQSSGTTVVAYIRRQRAERAKHLLRHSTMPLKVIAAQVNAGDMQSFSALVKKETGRAPGYWRRGEGT